MMREPEYDGSHFTIRCQELEDAPVQLASFSTVYHGLTAAN
jgi:hypothetical protein